MSILYVDKQERAHNMYTMPQDNATKFTAALAILVLTVIIVGSIVIFHDSSESSKSPISSSLISQSSSTSNYSYHDGTYSAVAGYTSPGGSEQIKVSVILRSNTVTSTTVISDASDAVSKSYQQRFINNYKSYVIGKKINTIHLSAVSGSSLTTKGFTSALQQIEKQAQA